MFSLVITIDTKNKLIPLEPQVVSRGFIYMKEAEELTSHFVSLAKDFILNQMNTDKPINILNIKNQLTEYLSDTIKKETDRRPIIIPIFMDITTY